MSIAYWPGQKYHRLTITKLIFELLEAAPRCECLCDCGNRIVVRKAYLGNGHTKSCGCLKFETMTQNRQTQVTHRMTDTREYQTWDAIVQRCTNKKNPAYKNYGGRGIKMCPEWRWSFEKFYEDIGPRPEGLMIHRINNDGDYCKDNCMWADWAEQVKNRRPAYSSYVLA